MDHMHNRCKECNRPLTPSQRKAERVRVAAYTKSREAWRKATEKTENDPKFKAFKAWVKAASTTTQADLNRRVD